MIITMVQFRMLFGLLLVSLFLGARGAGYVVGGTIDGEVCGKCYNLLLFTGYFPNWSGDLACHKMPVSAFNATPYTHVWYVTIISSTVHIIS